MKIINQIKILWLIPLLMALALLRPVSSFGFENTNQFSWLHLIPPGYWLDSWSFEATNWDSDFGFAPLSYSNIVQVPDWDDNALQVDSTNAAWLTYAITENAFGYGEYTNLSLHTGSIEFMFAPNWQSDDTNFYGNGPGDWGRFIDIGTWTTNADSDWWSLYLNPSGTSIYFSSGTNGVRTNYLNAPISWDSSTWHQIVLTFSPTNSLLYLDGQLAASGDGGRYLPSGSILTNGFAIGSDFATGMQQAHGQFDDLYIYNIQLSADDVASDYTDISSELPGSFHAMDDSPPFPGEGGGSGGGGGSGSGSYTPPDYGTNLWIQQYGISSNTFIGILSNTIPGVEYQLLSMNSLTANQWAYQGNPILAYTNSAPWSVPFSPTTNLFLNAMSFQDDTGTGIPDWWWLKYFGQDTNVDSYADPTGDGWTLLQDYQNGWNPTNFQTPPAPQGLAVTSFNSISNWATLTWLPSPGPVTGYTMQTPGGNVSLPSTSQIYLDQSSSSYASYEVQANYAGGNSAWSAPASVPSNQNSLSANIIGGPLGSAYLAVSAIPTNTVSIQITISNSFWNAIYTNFTIAVTDPTNGFYQIPNFSIAYGSFTYDGFITAYNANGNPVSASIYMGFLYQKSDFSDQNQWIVPPYFDGRKAMKQNLIFLLRAANENSPLSFQDDSVGIDSSYPNNYVYEGFYGIEDFDLSYGDAFDVFQPFEENYFYENFSVNPANVNSSGEVTNGPSGYIFPIEVNPVSQFVEPAANNTVIPALLNSNDVPWLCSYPPDAEDYAQMGIGYSFDDQDNLYFSMTNDVPNWFGLPFTSAAIVWGNESGDYTVLNANSTVENVNGYFYPATAWPKFQTLEYDFWANPGLDGGWAGYYPSDGVNLDTANVPGTSGFSTSYSNSLMIASVGDSEFQVACYAKLAVTNSLYTGVYGYLGQYFTNAYQINGSGNVTTNIAGMLSPYGQFFATVPGKAALVTMPDIDTGQQGTGVVYCVSMQVDKNHDGVMDTNFFGDDATSQGSPMEFWENNGCDAPNTSPSGGLDRDLQVPPNSPNYAPAQFYPLGHISCARDLENFARLWICGMPTLPTNGNYQVTLSWNVVSGTPAINLYNSVETNGGTGYLTDTNIAAEQCTATTISGGMSPYAVSFVGPDIAIAKITPSSSYTFPATNFLNSGNQYFLFEGAGIGKGELIMTISQNGNTIAQSGVWLDLHDVMDFYERAHIENIAKTFPAMRNNTNASTFISDYALPNNPNETNQLIVLVHGWRMSDYDYQKFSGTMYKRLYWQGYQGRFASLRWPTLSTDDFWFFRETQAYGTYNSSEYIAFRSAQGTSDYFDWLKSRFPNYSVNAVAHSMGNIVMMEALKIQLAMGHKDIDNYVLMQAAVPASCYDADAPGCPSLVAQESDSPTPNEYLTYPGSINNAINGSMINFFNASDYALNFWVANQLLKPDGTLGYTVLPGLETELLPSTVITDPREIMAFAARPRSYAVGAQSDVQGVISEGKQIDLAAQFGFTDANWDHSGEFNRNIQITGSFYHTLLISLFPSD